VREIAALTKSAGPYAIDITPAAAESRSR